MPEEIHGRGPRHHRWAVTALAVVSVGVALATAASPTAASSRW